MEEQPIAFFPGKPLELGLVMFPGFTMLDLIGPQTMLSMNSNSHFIAATMDPVHADSGGFLLPTATFDDAPKDLDILFVPGGSGVNAALRDERILEFLADRGARAKYITSACTGSLLLGAAGLLEGYRAATHWAFYDALEPFGAIPVCKRVVTDRNRVTGGGVTAGVDFGLALPALAKDEEVARLTQLLVEYDPDPPFDCGSIDRAGPERTAMARKLMSRDVEEAVNIAKAWGERITA